jgi:alanyl-tRNA synthetase
MTERLYYHDSYLTGFEATVASSEVASGARPGDPPRYRATLDRTAFYPTSGGQPFDAGVIGDARVLDVVDDESSHEIVHVVDRPLTVGAVVRGTVDWSRRFDHMQQHTGQHVLSAAFDRHSGVRTESFHLGSDSATIDLAREVSAREIETAVADANTVVWEDRVVAIRFVTAEEAASLPLRKEPAREGTLRLIEVPDYDLSACGGTHVARTGAIGIIVVPRWERFRSGSRVEFLCGGRARRRFDAWRDALTATTRHLSVASHELAETVERLQDENKALRRSVRDTQERLAVFEAQALVSRGTRIGTRVVVAEAMEDRDAAGLKALAMAAASEPGVAAALFTSSTPAQVVVARHPGSGVDASAVLKALTAAFGGKGGGKPDLAQGGGLQAPSADLIQTARDLLAR